MFGYVKIHKPELKVAEYDTYKALYCSLCKNLGKNYGHLLRLSLSYDFTFLTVLALSLQDQPCDFKKSRCVYNPFKKCYYNTKYNSILDKVSAVAAIMMYYKICDNIRDEKGLSNLLYRILGGLFKPKFKKAAKKYTDIYQIIDELNENQVKAEALDGLNLDVAAEPTATALAKVCQCFAVTDVDGERLYRIGYCVGKWIYLMDALEDREEDLKKGRYNPLVDCNDDDVIATMNVCSNEAGLTFETLPALHYGGIIKNILYLGLPRQIELYKQKKGESENERSV